MSNFRRIIKLEMDVEFFACVQGVSMILVYGFLQWLVGEPNVPFAIIFQMMIIGYVIAWIQKLLFLKEKAYGKAEYWVRGILWCLMPVILIIISGKLFHWFIDVSAGVTAAFYLIMVSYFIMVWLFVKYFYKEDTDEMNRQLKRRKDRGEKNI